MSLPPALTTSHPQSFTPFPTLPLELRNEIWSAALPGPRTIYLQQNHLKILPCTRVWSDVDISTPSSNALFFRIDIHHGRRHPARRRKLSRRPKYGPEAYGFTTQSKIPLAYACRESRAVVLQKQYIRAFGTASVGPSVWINFEVDTLYVDWGYQPGGGAGSRRLSYLPWDFGDDRKKVRNLAVFDADYMHDLEPTRLGYTSWIDTILRGFGNVKELTVVDRYHSIEKGNCGDLVVWEKMVHVEASLVGFLNPGLMERERYLRTEEVLMTLDWKHGKNVQLKANIEVHALQRFQMFVATRFPTPTYEFLRVIQWRTVTTREVWEEYERGRKAFEKRKEEYDFEVILRCDGVNELRFEVKGCEKLYDLALGYLKAQKFPNGLVLLCANTPLRVLDTATIVASLARMKSEIEVEIIFLSWDRKFRSYVWAKEALQRKFREKMLAERKEAALTPPAPSLT